MSEQKHITVEQIYKGERINQAYLDKNPDVASLMPKQSEFMTVYRTVMDQVTETGKYYKITISENGIETKEINL